MTQGSDVDFHQNDKKHFNWSNNWGICRTRFITEEGSLKSKQIFFSKWDAIHRLTLKIIWHWSRKLQNSYSRRISLRKSSQKNKHSRSWIFPIAFPLICFSNSISISPENGVRSFSREYFTKPQVGKSIWDIMSWL